VPSASTLYRALRKTCVGELTVHNAGLSLLRYEGWTNIRNDFHHYVA
jgi:hypothetical protein